MAQPGYGNLGYETKSLWFGFHGRIWQNAMLILWNYGEAAFPGGDAKGLPLLFMTIFPDF
jgi:hypothetical protein